MSSIILRLKHVGRRMNTSKWTKDNWDLQNFPMPVPLICSGLLDFGSQWAPYSLLIVTLSFLLIKAPGKATGKVVSWTNFRQSSWTFVISQVNWKHLRMKKTFAIGIILSVGVHLRVKSHISAAWLVTCNCVCHNWNIWTTPEKRFFYFRALPQVCPIFRKIESFQIYIYTIL